MGRKRIKTVDVYVGHGPILENSLGLERRAILGLETEGSLVELGSDMVYFRGKCAVYGDIGRELKTTKFFAVFCPRGKGWYMTDRSPNNGLHARNSEPYSPYLLLAYLISDLRLPDGEQGDHIIITQSGLVDKVCEEIRKLRPHYVRYNPVQFT